MGHENAGPMSTSRDRVLMVDDDSFVLMILSHVVADAGLEPVTCTTSARCLDLLRPDSFAQSPYTVLLLDWELADMNALQLLQQLDQGGEHLKDKMRIFVVSGSPPPDDFSAACAVLRYLTVEHWWTKPVTAAQIRELKPQGLGAEHTA